MKIIRYIYILLLCLTWVGCSSVVDDDNQVVERVHVGDRVPSFSVTMTDGGEERTFSTSQLTGETVIVFFNTWCPDCQRELPRLNQYYLQHMDDKGFQMVAISRGEGKDVVARFWSEHELLIPYAAQEDTSIYELFASGIIPRVYFVSAQGIVTRIDVERFAI